MKNNSSTSEIITFLEKAKILISAGKYDFVPRRKNMQALAQYKKNIDGIKFYVKVKIVTENGSEILKCIGFHEDDFS